MGSDAAVTAYPAPEMDLVGQNGALDAKRRVAATAVAKVDTLVQNSVDDDCRSTQFIARFQSYNALFFRVIYFKARGSAPRLRTRTQENGFV